MRKGERLMDAGQFADAIPLLNEACQLLRGANPHVQATSWNLLGLAYHGAGQNENASRAYLEALKFDRNLWAADFNMGCLSLDQSNYAGAIDYFTTYTSAHQKDAQGYLLLGRARLKLALERPLSERDRRIQLDNARLDFQYAEKLHPTAEACNALGIIELQRRIPGTEPVKTSLDYFRTALKRDPHYAPAMLDLAIVLHRYANEPQEALENYRQYLAQQPPPPQAADVEKIAHKLDVESRITIVSHSDHPAPQPVVSNAAPPRQAPAPVARQSQPVAEDVPPEPVPAPSSATVEERTPAPRAVSRVPSNPAPVQVAESAPPPVQPQPAPIVGQVSSAPSAPRAVKQNNNANITMLENPEAPPVEQRRGGFFQRINPANWFHSRKAEPAPDLSTPQTATIERYAYPLPVTPIPGDRKLAEQLTAGAQQSDRQMDHAQAFRQYQDALKADPTYYEAGLGLGLAAIDAKKYSVALDALSQALSVQPNSADARYAFAWVLGRKGYYIDAANELNKLLAAHPQELRAHLLLGNYLADNLDQPRLARAEYEKALTLCDPQSSQAAIIRAWLDQHP
jgi:tetratricopeptide (TPR) repeat protein